MPNADFENKVLPSESIEALPSVIIQINELIDLIINHIKANGTETERLKKLTKKSIQSLKDQLSESFNENVSLMEEYNYLKNRTFSKDERE